MTPAYARSPDAWRSVSLLAFRNMTPLLAVVAQRDGECECFRVKEEEPPLPGPHMIVVDPTPARRRWTANGRALLERLALAVEDETGLPQPVPNGQLWAFVFSSHLEAVQFAARLSHLYEKYTEAVGV